MYSSANLVSTSPDMTKLTHQQKAPVVVPPPAQSNVSEILVLGSLIQSVQTAQTQQMYVLRDIDSRLSRLEDSARYSAAAPPPANPSFERATWWAIWGLLMLILGGALAIVTLLILLNIQFR
jgi:hypothetical protein